MYDEIKPSTEQNSPQALLSTPLLVPQEQPVAGYATTQSNPTPVVSEIPSPIVSPMVVSEPQATKTDYSPPMYDMAPKRRFSWFKSFAYLPEYLVMLLMLTALLYAVTRLLNIGIDSIIHAEKSTSSSSSLSSLYDISTFELVSSLATVAVSLPAFIVLYMRTKASETENPDVRTHRWRKGFLASFIVVQMLTIVGNLTSLAYQIISRMVDGKDALSLITGSTQGDPVWQLVLASILNVVLIAFVVFVIAKDYRSKETA